MPAASHNEPKRWRVRGKARDGLVVTLGRYDTEEQAHADCQKFAAEAVYCELSVQAIAPPPAGEAPPGGPPAGRRGPVRPAPAKG